ncbi:MAG: hypothetical protein PWP03_442 [Candidatus Woesearchaeota archaeon]|nr:hypothetical protein [Candidatus Woesearchaeota archaeon]MDN5327804.1 hypothetical protein [Candidatus Woesearchaeota archaeon]
MDNLPVFLKIDEFKKLRANVDELKEKVELAERLIKELKQANEEEKKRIESFESQLTKLKNLVQTIDSKVQSNEE